MNFKQLMKNRKGISPIFATLILIAIAVIAGVVVYMFVSGTLATMTGGGAAAQEKVAIQSASYDSGTVKVYATCSSGPLPTVNGMIIKDTQGNTVDNAVIDAENGFTAIGALDTIEGTITIDVAGTYTATLTTAAGGSFVSPSFVVVAAP
jgi:archaeal type IV pilus assembly protein PilA